MTEDELRSLVREAVARHLGTAPGPIAPARSPWGTHPSHGRFVVLSGKDTDGPCLIEPAVRCNHCGYCQSWGH